MGKQHKKQFFKNNQIKTRRGEELKAVLKGVLIMCDKNREKSSVKDAYDILNNSIEEYYPELLEELNAHNQKLQEEFNIKLNEKLEEEKNQINENNNSLDLKEEDQGNVNKDSTEIPKDTLNKEDSLEKDNLNENTDEDLINNNHVINDNHVNNKDFKNNSHNKNNKYNDRLQRPKLVRFFYNFETNCKGIVFIKIDDSFKDKIDIIELIRNIFNRSKKEKQQLSSNISKLFPIEYCSKTNNTNLDIGGKVIYNKMLSLYEKDSEKKNTYRVEFRSRNNSSIKKVDAIDILLNNIDSEIFKVDYDNAKYTIFVDITCDLLCMSILQDFNLNRGYNLINLIKSDEELKQHKEIQFKLNEENKLAKDKFKEKYGDINENNKENNKENGNSNDNNLFEDDDDEEVQII